METPWIKTKNKIEFDNLISKIVLFEKFCPEKVKQIEMFNFFLLKINKCNTYTYKYTPNIIYFEKNGEIIIELNTINKHCWIRYYNIWKVFEDSYGFNYDKNNIKHIINVIENILNKIMGSKGHTAGFEIRSKDGDMELLLKSQGYKEYSYI